MNGIQLERFLTLIDGNIHYSMESVRAEVLAYLQNNTDLLARDIATRGYGNIPTQAGIVKVTQEDLDAVYA
jgi:hypothetical protein